MPEGYVFHKGLGYVRAPTAPVNQEFEAGVQLEQRAERYAEARDVSFGEALTAVVDADPELAARWSGFELKPSEVDAEARRDFPGGGPFPIGDVIRNTLAKAAKIEKDEELSPDAALAEVLKRDAFLQGAWAVSTSVRKDRRPKLIRDDQGNLTGLQFDALSDPGAEVDRCIGKYMAENPDVKFEQAMDHVLESDPDLAREYGES